MGLGAASAPPRRIVSLNPCVDAILVEVADRGQIAAISHYSRDPSSSSIDAAGAGYPVTFGGVEEVLALRPDLVLSGGYASSAARAAFGRLGVRLELFAVPETVAESIAQVRRIAEVVGRPQRGAALAARIEAALAAAAPPPGAPRLSAITYQARGFAAGPGSLMDEMMRRCGFDNAVTRYGLKYSGEIPLERLIADPPDVLLAGQAAPGAPAWVDRALSHPALERVAARMRRATFPQQLTFCGGPVLIRTAALLAKVREATLAARGGG